MTTDLAIRIKRMLVLVPWLAAQEKAVQVERARRFAGYDSREEFLNDLELLTYIGAPPFAPDNLIEVYVENDHVHLVLPQAFERPPALSAVECAALIAAAEPMRDAAGEVLERAVAKLTKALPPNSHAAVDEYLRNAAIEAPPSSKWHAPLKQGIEERRELLVDYWAAIDGEARVRKLEPRRLFIHGGRWYLAAWNVDAKEEHLYRLDRIRDVTLGERRFAEHQGRDRREYERDVLFVGAERYPEVEVVFDKSIARLALEQWGSLARENADGTVTVVAHMAGESYAVSWAMGFAGQVRFVRPAGYQQALQRRAAQMLEKMGAPAEPVRVAG